MAGVLRRRCYSEIFDAVIRLVMIDVMNNFVFAKFPANGAFHDGSMEIAISASIAKYVISVIPHAYYGRFSLRNNPKRLAPASYDASRSHVLQYMAVRSSCAGSDLVRGHSAHIHLSYSPVGQKWFCRVLNCVCRFSASGNAGTQQTLTNIMLRAA